MTWVLCAEIELIINCGSYKETVENSMRWFFTDMVGWAHQGELSYKEYDPMVWEWLGKLGYTVAFGINAVWPCSKKRVFVAHLEYIYEHYIIYNNTLL